MSLLDLFTGGKSSEATDALNQAQSRLAQIHVPDISELTLPELQKYVQQGVLTPEQAQAVLQQGNAYDQINTSSKPVEAEMSALSQMQDIAESGGLDAQAKAAIAKAQNNAQVTAQGQRGSIIDQMAARGIPTSLISEALQSAAVGQDAQNQNLADTQAASDAEQRALAALGESATLGGNIHGQEYNEVSNKAAAQNAIQQWNAQNQTNVNLANTTAKNQAQQLNQQTAQDVSNKNTNTSNQRTQYNANLPQQTFNNQITKATGQANIGDKQANLATGQGEQNAGIYSGLIGAGSSLLGTGVQAAAMKNAFPGQQDTMIGAASEGGTVPGKAPVSGDSPKNDRVPTMLSAGEVVVPRSIAPHPELAKQFISHVMRNKVPIKPAHPDDVRSVLEALHSRRGA